MRSINLLKSVMLVVLLSGCATINEKLSVSYDHPKADSYWVERNPPTRPLNAAEALAVKSATGLMTIKRGKNAAYYETQENSFTLIRHEQAKTGDDASVITVKYRISHGLIYGETIPAFAVKLDPEKTRIAQEVAIDAENGKSPVIPTLYNGRIFVVKNNFYNSCTYDVVEKDLDREYATYRVKGC